MKSITRPILAAMLLTNLLAGCHQQVAPCPPAIGYHLASPQELQQVRNVVFVGLTGPVDYDQVSIDLTRELFQTIQGRRLFQVDIVDNVDPTVATMSAAGREPLTLDQMSQLATSLGCDAVLYGTVVEFQAYPRMRLALRLRLVDVRRGKLLWGVDQVWDTSEKSIERRIEKYYHSKQTNQNEPLEWQMFVISPKSFEKFIAYEVGQTLPCNATPQPPDRPKMPEVDAVDQVLGQ